MDIQGGDIFSTLCSFLTTSIKSFPDLRNGKNTQYSMKDIALSAFGVFFCQSPSFLAYQRLMQEARGNNNGRTLFGIQKLPTDNQIRNLLDPVDPKLLWPAYRQTFKYLQKQGVVKRFRSFANTLLVAIDGTGYFYSESIHCDQCSVAHHRDGRVTYSHTALMPAVVGPDIPQVIPLEPEFVTPQDGHKKQDCEAMAAKRWIRSMGNRLSLLGVTLLGDALYATQTMIKVVVKKKLNYLFVAKPKHHKYLYEELQSFEKLGEIQKLKRTQWTGKKHRHLLYRYINRVPLVDAEHPIEVNWVEFSITNDKGEITYRTAFITNHLITEQNVEALVKAGRCRWKIENEDINTLKTKGYHFEHNFGHGTQYLSQLLLSLNILAFLFHTVLELLDKRCTLLRSTLPRRDTFFQHISALTQYLCFESWQHLMLFMLTGLKLQDPYANPP
jgi:TfoX/Sxy family transcriptional regulator of competence genes